MYIYQFCISPNSSASYHIILTRQCLIILVVYILHVNMYICVCVDICCISWTSDASCHIIVSRTSVSYYTYYKHYIYTHNVCVYIYINVCVCVCVCVSYPYYMCE
jgi:hypothetical protein